MAPDLWNVDCQAEATPRVRHENRSVTAHSGVVCRNEEAPDTRYAPVSGLAANPDQMAVGAITRSATEAVTGFAVVWPDGATGVFAGTESTTVPGAVDSYTLTHVLGGVTTTYTQPAFTRNASGSVTNRPAMTVS